MLILCIKIFLVRIIDVSLGTVRTMLIVRNKRLFASLIGFIETLIWFLIVKEALGTTSNSILIAIFYSLGFAMGTYIGTFLSDYFIKGKISIQVFTNNSELEIILRKKGYAVTSIESSGYNSNNYMLYILVDKKKEKIIKKIIKNIDNDAFIVVEEIKYVENGYFK